MPSRFILPYADIGAGIQPSSGALLYFYETGTSTPKDTYSDSAATTPNTNPVVANSVGVFGDIWIDGTYKVVLKDSTGATKWEADPISDTTVSINTIANSAKTYTDVSAMIADAANITDGKTVIVTGYHPSSTIGGGSFVYDASKAQTEHTGGKIIAKDAVFPTDFINTTQVSAWLAGTGTGSGCFVALDQSSVTLEQYGVRASNTADVNQLLIQQALDVGPVVITFDEGTFNYTPPLVLNRSGVTLTGANRYTSILASSAVDADALKLGDTASISGIVLKNFRLTGNSTCRAGLLIGNATHYCITLDIDSIYIEGFSNPTYGGNIKIQRGWWINGRKITSESGLHSLHVPSGSVITTVTFEENCTFRNATDSDILLEGTATIDVLNLNNISIEYSEKEAIKSTATKAVINLNTVYFEQNSASGTGIIDITGGSGAADYTMLNMDYCTTDAPLSGDCMNLSYVRKSNIKNCYGWQAQPIVTDANCDIDFYNLNGQSSADFLTAVKSMSGKLSAVEYAPSVGKWVRYNSEAHIYDGHLATQQTTAPTIAIAAAAGTGASAILTAGSTDTAGRIEITYGSGSWSNGAQATITLNKAYTDTRYRVFLQPASNKSVVQQTIGLSPTIVTSQTFTLDLVTAESAAGLAYYDYFIIET